MLRRHIVLLIAIRPSDGVVKPGGPLGAFREEQAMSRHRVPKVHYTDIRPTHMPGFSKVRYRFYSDIDRLTAVLALHERKIAHPFDKCLLT